MRIVRDHRDLSEPDRGASAAIGNFDGVHLGHQAVIDLARRSAHDLSCPLGVLTFDPHPREYFRPDGPPFRLMNAAAKAHRMEKLGVDCLYTLPFNDALAGLSAHDFARQVLSDGLGLRHVVVGADFCFGKGRVGTADDLRAFGAELGFGVTIADLLEIGSDAGPVSSTRIRDALAAGDPKAARAMLGHWHRIEGPVLHGAKRGRDLGYPTANMSIDGLHRPAFGVYAVQVEVLDGPSAGLFGGVASMGVRPMFDAARPNLETHLFDYSGDLYGATLSVALIAYLRPEQRFDGIDALVAQMDRDSAAARDILGALPA